MTELLPCPFCGGEATLLIDAKYGYWTFHHDGKPKCPAAYSHYADYSSEAEAIAAWNARAERTCNLGAEVSAFGVTLNMLADIPWYWCLSCGAATPSISNYCMHCGAKVVVE